MLQQYDKIMLKNAVYTGQKSLVSSSTLAKIREMLQDDGGGLSLEQENIQGCWEVKKEVDHHRPVIMLQAEERGLPQDFLPEGGQDISLHSMAKNEGPLAA